MVLSAIAFVATPRGGDVALVAIAFAMGAGAFDVVRNIPLAVIATVAPLTRHSHLIAIKLSGYDSAVSSIKSARLSWRGQAVLIAASVFLLLENRGLLSPRIPAAMDYPVGAIAFMRAHQLHGNILARFEWGQYVIFQLGPPSRIFVDGRVDLVYPPEVIEEYLDFFAGRPRGARILADYSNDYVLMPSGSPADATMKSRSDWQPIYRDGVAVLFAPANSTAAHIPSVPIIAPAPASAFP